MDIFENKAIKPMLIGAMQAAFDSSDFIFELKLDGERCIAYLDKEQGTELRNKRNMNMLKKVPELSGMHRQVNSRCILDGELVVIKNGKPDFDEIKTRSLTTNSFKIQLAASKYPASFIAFDILYYQNREVTAWPLMERKQLLEKTVTENDRFAISRYIEEKGMEFYRLTEQNQLEGIVAKRKDSKYYFDKRTSDWIKIKNLQDDDFVICGYIQKEKGVASIVLGQYSEGVMLYKGHVTLGLSTSDFKVIKSATIAKQAPFTALPHGNENVVWLEPLLVCTVKYMTKSESGFMRQPVFKGLRDDKLPAECLDS